MKSNLVVALFISPAFSKSFIMSKLRKLDGSNVEAWDMPANVGDYASNLSPEMVAQAHEKAAGVLPGEAHSALNSQLPENLRMNENVEAFEMPVNVGDYASNLSPDMIAQAHD
jgi:hypothetical protein